MEAHLRRLGKKLVSAMANTLKDSIKSANTRVQGVLMP